MDGKKEEMTNPKAELSEEEKCGFYNGWCSLSKGHIGIHRNEPRLRAEEGIGEACSDCDVVNGKVYCTMNCGPAIPIDDDPLGLKSALRITQGHLKLSKPRVTPKKPISDEGKPTESAQQEEPSYLTLPKLIREMKPHHNEIGIIFDGELARLIGVAETEEDFYYIVTRRFPDYKPHMYSCVGAFEGLKGKIDRYGVLEACFAMNGSPATTEFLTSEPLPAASSTPVSAPQDECEGEPCWRNPETGYIEYCMKHESLMMETDALLNSMKVVDRSQRYRECRSDVLTKLMQELVMLREKVGQEETKK